MAATRFPSTATANRVINEKRGPEATPIVLLATSRRLVYGRSRRQIKEAGGSAIR